MCSLYNKYEKLLRYTCILCILPNHIIWNTIFDPIMKTFIHHRYYRIIFFNLCFRFWMCFFSHSNNELAKVNESERKSIALNTPSVFAGFFIQPRKMPSNNRWWSQLTAVETVLNGEKSDIQMFFPGIDICGELAV